MTVRHPLSVALLPVLPVLSAAVASAGWSRGQVRDCREPSMRGGGRLEPR